MHSNLNPSTHTHTHTYSYRYAVRIAAAFDMDTPRVAFVNSLKKFTLLGTTKEMHQKNIDAIKMLLKIAHTEGNHLKGLVLFVL